MPVSSAFTGQFNQYSSEVRKRIGSFNANILTNIRNILMHFKRTTYSNQIYEYIKKQIMDGELPPGSPIKETTLSSYLGVSRAPIREALQKLCHEGIVVSEAQKGKFVRSLSSKDIVDSYTLTGILESSGVLYSLELWTDSDMARLEQIVEAMHQRIYNDSRIKQLVNFEELFHSSNFPRLQD